MARTKASVKAGFHPSRVTPGKPYRNMNKNYTPRKSGTVVGRSIGFPKSMLMKHKYVQNVLASSVSGVLVTQNFRANGMYDPDQTGGGHQPIYFDQMATLYNHYTVIGSKIKVTFADANSTADVVPVYYGIFLNDDTSISGLNYISLQEQSLGKSSMTCANTTQGNQQFTYKFSAKKIFKGSVMGNPDLVGTAASDPSEQSIYTIWFQPSDGTADVSKYLRVEIEYIAVWTELKDIASS